MVPFSFFLIVPFAEFGLPLYLLLFPNSIPSQFISHEETEKKMNIMKEKWRQAAEILISQFKKFINKIDAKYADNPNYAPDIKYLRDMTDELFSFTMTH